MSHSLQSISSYVAKIFGEKYVPCRDLSEMMSEAKVLHLVLRGKESLFCKGSYIYTFPGHHIRDVLRSKNESGGPTPSLPNDEDLTLTYQAFKENKQSSLHIGAGAGITKSDANDSKTNDCGLKIDSSSSTSIVADLSITEIKDDLIEEIKNEWLFDKNHRIWERINETGEELFLITNIVFTTSELSLSSDVSASGKIWTALEFLGAHLKIKKEVKQSSVIQKGAVLAYKIQQLPVDDDDRVKRPVGTMSPEVVGDSQMSIEPQTEIENCRQLYLKYCGTLSSEKQAKLRIVIKDLLLAAMPVPPEDSEESVNRLPSGDGNRGGVHRLERLKNMMKSALRINSSTKVKETTELLHELGVQGFLDLSKESDVVYGVRYFVTALLCLHSDALPRLSDCASEKGKHEMSQVVTELEKVLHCVDEEKVYSVDGVAENVKTFLSLALLEDEESFLYAWRAAYVSAIYLCGLPAVASASA